MNDKFSLDTLQAWMKDSLMFPRLTDTSDINDHIYHSKRLTAVQRFGVYQRSYYLRLLKCMEGQFPALCFALGKDLFNDFTLQYLQAYPSKSYTLYELGTRFPNYLKETRPDKDNPEQWVNFMIDLATFEQSLFQMYDASGDENSIFANPSTADNQLKLQSCFKLGDYGFDVATYYHQVKFDKKPEFPQPSRSMIAFVRMNYRTHTIPIRETHYILLNSIQNGMSVSQALEQVIIKCNLDKNSVLQSWQDPNGIRKRWIENCFFTVK